MDINHFIQCGNLAREGLRTLVVAKKVLTDEQYQDFEVNLTSNSDIIGSYKMGFILILLTVALTFLATSYVPFYLTQQHYKKNLTLSSFCITDIL